MTKKILCWHRDLNKRPADSRIISPGHHLLYGICISPINYFPVIDGPRPLVSQNYYFNHRQSDTERESPIDSERIRFANPILYKFFLRRITLMSRTNWNFAFMSLFLGKKPSLRHKTHHHRLILPQHKLWCFFVPPSAGSNDMQDNRKSA